MGKSELLNLLTVISMILMSVDLLRQTVTSIWAARRGKITWRRLGRNALLVLCAMVLLPPVVMILFGEMAFHWLMTYLPLVALPLLSLKMLKYAKRRPG